MPVKEDELFHENIVTNFIPSKCEGRTVSSILLSPSYGTARRIREFQNVQRKTRKSSPGNH